MRRCVSLAAAVVITVLGAPAPSAAPAPTPSLQPPAPQSCDGCWMPPLGARWQYQLQGSKDYPASGGIDVNVAARPFGGGAPVRPAVFDIDLYVDSRVAGNDSTPNVAAVDAIHAQGDHVICYVNGGAWEEWRPDAADFPEDVKGKPLEGWPGERWLDIRQRDVLLPLMEARVAGCRDAGFDAVEWDNVDGYTQDSGFDITAADQVAYNAELANLSHAYGLSVGLKNDLEQIDDLVSYFDFAVNEQCAQYRECGMLRPFVDAGKAVFQVEYELRRDRFCPRAKAARRSAIKKTYDLFARPWKPCR